MWHKKKILYRFWQVHRHFVVLTFFVSIISGLFTIAVPVAIGKYYDFLFGFHSFRARLLDVIPVDLNNIENFLVFFLVLVLLRTIFLFFEKYYIGILGEKLVYEVRNLLFTYQLKLPIRDYEDKGMGRYLLRFSGDLNSAKNYMTRGVVRFLSDVIILSMAIGLLFWLDYRLGLFMLIGLFAPLMVLWVINRKLSILTGKYRNLKSSLLSFTNSRLRGIHTIRFFNKEKPEQIKFLKKTDKILEAGIQYQKTISLINSFVPGSLYLLLTALFAFIYFYGLNASVASGGNVLIFIILLLTILPVMRRMLRINIVWELGNISYEKLAAVLNRAETEGDGLKVFRFKNGMIELQKLSYGYGTKDGIFDEVNLKLGGQNLVVVSGKTGSGKTTLIKLLCKLYHPTSGQILIDGQMLNSLDGKSLRRRVAVVSDEIPLLGKTVFEAISYSRKPEKRLPALGILRYLEANNPDIPEVPLDSRIGDLGCNLSKGQRKLLAYARAILTDKKIIFIDEPFEGIPAQAVQFWVNEIKNLSQIKKVVVFTALPFVKKMFGEVQIIDLDTLNAKSKNKKEAV